MSAGSAHVVRASVARAQRADLAARALEALALGAAALGAALLAATVERGWAPGRELFLAATLAGLACALAWLVERAGARADAARALDRALGEDGLVLSAWEARARAASSPEVEALERRAAARLAGRSAARAVRAPRMALALAPLAVLALLAWTVERSDERALRDPSSATMPTAAPGGEVDAASLLAVGAPREVAARAEALARELDALAAADPARPTRAGRAEEIARELEGLAAELREHGARSDPARALEALARRARERASAGGASSSAGGEAADASAGETGSGALGTMVRSSAPEEDPPRGGAPERGVVLRGWPASDDELVRRWLAERAAGPRR